MMPPFIMVNENHYDKGIKMDKIIFPYDDEIQTPIKLIEYMISLIPDNVKTILEPTPGKGNIVKLLKEKNYTVFAPNNYNDIDIFKKYDAIVMNPPWFKSIEHKILYEMMNLSKIIIAVMPWFTITNCDSRIEYLLNFGLKSITHLPRRAFKKIRINPCIINLQKGYQGKIEFNYLNLKK